VCECRGISTPDFRYKSEFVNALIEDNAQRVDVIDDINDDVEQNDNNADASDDDNYNDVESVASLAVVSVNERAMSLVEQAAHMNASLCGSMKWSH